MNDVQIVKDINNAITQRLITWKAFTAMAMELLSMDRNNLWILTIRYFSIHYNENDPKTLANK